MNKRVKGDDLLKAGFGGALVGGLVGSRGVASLGAAVFALGVVEKTGVFNQKPVKNAIKSKRGVRL